jgi:hypothetical protein
LWRSRDESGPERGADKTMIERIEQRFDIKPERLAGDTAYGSGANLNWLVNEAKIAPHIPVVDKSKREDRTFSWEDFNVDKEQNVYICPAGCARVEDHITRKRIASEALPRLVKLGEPETDRKREGQRHLEGIRAARDKTVHDNLLHSGSVSAPSEAVSFMFSL